jgi:plasmid maintenance system killer protein
MDSVAALHELNPAGQWLETLARDRSQHSIRINSQYQSV